MCEDGESFRYEAMKSQHLQRKAEKRDQAYQMKREKSTENCEGDE